MSTVSERAAVALSWDARVPRTAIRETFFVVLESVLAAGNLVLGMAAGTLDLMAAAAGEGRDFFGGGAEDCAVSLLRLRLTGGERNVVAREGSDGILGLGADEGAECSRATLGLEASGEVNVFEWIFGGAILDASRDRVLGSCNAVATGSTGTMEASQLETGTIMEARGREVVLEVVCV